MLRNPKICTKCKVVKPAVEFGLRLDVKSKLKLLSRCRECHRLEAIRIRKNAPARGTIYAKKSNAKLKREFYEAYGNACACCGEREPAFLTLEHLNGSKRDFANRRGFVAQCTLTYLSDLRKRGWPKNEATVLCFNCNCVKSRVDVCPHISKKEAVV